LNQFRHVVGSADKVRGRGGRNSRQNLHAHLLHNRLLPGGVRTHRVRQLLCPDGVRRSAGIAGPVGHGGPGGLRQAPATLIPTDGRVPDLFLRGVPVLVRERDLEVVPRNQTSLPRRPNTSYRDQDRSARGQGGAAGPLRQRPRAPQAGAGSETSE